MNEAVYITADQVKRQTEDRQLVGSVTEIADKYNGTGVMCTNVHEYNTLMR